MEFRRINDVNIQTQYSYFTAVLLTRYCLDHMNKVFSPELIINRVLDLNASNLYFLNQLFFIFPNVRHLRYDLHAGQGIDPRPPSTDAHRLIGWPPSLYTYNIPL